MGKAGYWYVRIAVGLGIWIVAGALLWMWLDQRSSTPVDQERHLARELWTFATAERRVVRVQLDGNWPLAVGDPIYGRGAEQEVEQIGEVRQVWVGESAEGGGAGGPMAEVLLYPVAPPLTKGSHLTYYATPQSLGWVLETMLPPQKQIRIAEEILLAYEEHHQEILRAVKPIVVGGLIDAMQVMEKDLIAALARRREALESLGSRYQDQVVQQEIVPLVREEIWPIVMRNAEPLANQIGEELFERASLWRFGWRLLYDKSFLPEKNLTQEEWNRFVKEEGLPVLDSHTGEFVAVQRKILEDIAKNPRVRQAVHQNLTSVLDDPEFRTIVWEVFREVIVDNPRLRQRLEQRWNTVEAREAMQLAADYVEPCVRRIGDLLFGTREDGIAPEFAQVLRNQILDKDCRWLVLNAPTDAASLETTSTKTVLPVHMGGYPDVNPFAVQLQEAR